MKTLIALLFVLAMPASAQDKPVSSGDVNDDLNTVPVSAERGEIRFKDLKSMLEDLERRQAALARDLATMRFALEQAEIQYDPDKQSAMLMEQIKILQRKLERLERDRGN